MECLFTLNVSSHTKTTFELDSQHAPSSSSRVGLRQYPKSHSTRVPDFASTRVDSHRNCGFRASACVVCSCEVCASACVFSSRLLFAALLHGSVARLLFTASLHGCAVAESTRYFIVFSVLPLKLGKSGIVNPRSFMNCHSLSAPRLS